MEQTRALEQLKLNNEQLKLNNELRIKELEMGVKSKGKEDNWFDVGRNIKLVPKFNERNVDEFFVSFEKIASQLEWPEDKWAIMLSVVLTGKGQVAYSTLSDDDSSNYQVLKKAVLREYELVPEAYRQKFRSLHKVHNETYTEFAKQKERLFED